MSPLSPDDRKPVVITDFSKGVQLKADAFGEPEMMRLTGCKFGRRLGSLETRGGFDNWDVGTDFTYLLGMKRWYRADGGVGTYVVGVTTAGTLGIFQLNLHNKTLSSLYTIADSCNLDEPAQFVDCGDQLIVIPSLINSRPYSIKRQESESVVGDGGTVVRKLGLDPPTQAIAAAQTSINTQNSNGTGATDDGLDNGVYQYTYTYVYGTPSNPTLYGESANGPIATIVVNLNTTGAVGVLVQLTGIPSFGPNGVIRAIRIYRTLKDADVFYRIGEIDANSSDLFFNDGIDDASIDVSKILPTYTGLPETMDCAEWSQTDQRLWWFDKNTGYLRYSAAGRPDVNPSNQYVAVGNLGYRGRGIKFVQDQRFVFKEDGIYRIFGEAPNYVPRKVSPVQCVSQGSLAEMPDGVYFLGMESGEMKVFRFDGNTALPISGPIEDILKYRTQTTAKRAFGKRVGNEYWLSITVDDVRFAAWPTPYNNLILPYDYRYGAWAGPFPAQAAYVETFDGPGDKGETFILESDPTSSATKGNLYRLEAEKSTSNQTTYVNGTRFYNSVAAMGRRLSFGVIPGITQDGLQTVDGIAAKIRVRGIFGENISCGPYADSLTLSRPISSGATFVIQESLKVSSQWTSINKFGTTYGTGKYVDNIEEEYLFNLRVDVPQTGIILDFLYSNFTANRLFQIEAVEFLAKYSRRV